MNYFCKTILVSLFFLCSQTLVSQCDCIKYYSPKSFLSIALLDDEKVNIIDEKKSYRMEDIINAHIQFEGKYRSNGSNLSLVVKNKEYLFRKTDRGVIEALDAIEGNVERGEKFYCYFFVNKNNRLYYEIKNKDTGWKNGKMDGVWVYRDERFNIHHITYKNGEIIEKIRLQPIPTISVELSVKWEKGASVFDEDSIESIPKLLIKYRNNSNANYYFLKLSDSRSGYPMLPWGSLIQYPIEEYLNPDYKKRAETHLDYTGQHFFVKVRGIPLFSKGWIVEIDTIPQEREIEFINDDLANIYRYLYSKNYGDQHSVEDCKLYFSTSDLTPDGISNAMKDRFVFLKPKEVHTDIFNLIGFKSVKGHFTFWAGKNHFDDYVLIESKWDDIQSKYVDVKIPLPTYVGEHTLYSGDFNINKLEIEF